jgi:hypothetical protein
LQKGLQLGNSLTKDGAEFKLGMTLITDSGGEIQTNEEYFIVFSEYGYNFIGRKNGCMFTPTNHFFSSHAARLIYYKKYLQQMKEEVQTDIDKLDDILEHEDPENLCQYSRGDFLYL